MIALAIKYWWAFVIGALVIALAASETRRHNANERLADYRATTEANIRRASEAARQEESRRQEQVDMEAASARTEIEALQSDVMRLADVADGMRDAAAVANRRARASACASNGGKTAAQARDVPANVLGELTERARILAEAADRSRIAGDACTRSYEALRSEKVQQH